MSFLSCAMFTKVFRAELTFDYYNLLIIKYNVNLKDVVTTILRDKEPKDSRSKKLMMSVRNARVSDT